MEPPPITMATEEDASQVSGLIFAHLQIVNQKPIGRCPVQYIARLIDSLVSGVARTGPSLIDWQMFAAWPPLPLQPCRGNGFIEDASVKKKSSRR